MADADSTFLLEELLRPPDAPPLLCSSLAFAPKTSTRNLFSNNFSYKREAKIVVSCSLDHWLAANERIDALALAAADVSGEPFINSIVHEAAGSPFLLEQLTHYGMMNERAATAGISLTTMLEERMKQLSPGARQLLNVLAVARRPVDEAVALNASGVSGDPLQFLTPLRAAQFIRSGGKLYGVEVYHDRIGEAIGSLLDEGERRQIHRRLAQTIEARGLDDPEGLYERLSGRRRN